MELKDRIKTIMDNENLNASIFADIVGVQRSSISHILSGRNKPSLDFLQKVLTSYPKYSTEWLIMGEGSHLKRENTATINRESQKIYEETPDLFAELDKQEQQSQHAHLENIENDKKGIADNENVDIESTENQEIKDKINIEIEKKEVEQIIICYTDKTFISYKPA